jgi:hypothetical protein
MENQEKVARTYVCGCCGGGRPNRCCGGDRGLRSAAGGGDSGVTARAAGIGVSGKAVQPYIMFCQPQLPQKLNQKIRRHELTAINGLGGDLGLLASVVLSGLLEGKASGGARIVQIAAVVHGALESVSLPAEHVITVGSRATVSKRSAVCYVKKEQRQSYTYPMPMASTKGLEPSVGRRAASLNSRTSNMISYMIWGSFTGWLDGQAPPPLAPVPE